MTAVFRILSLVILFGLGLVACGEGDSGNASEPAAQVETSTASKFMHDQDVIYQEEIYANWPYN